MIEDVTENLLKNLLKELDDRVFITSTDCCGNIEKLNSKIEDREGTIYIKGEWDREDLKDGIKKAIKNTI